jgi:hypothetical protein
MNRYVIGASGEAAASGWGRRAVSTVGHTNCDGRRAGYLCEQFESVVVGGFVAMCGVVRFRFNLRVYVRGKRNIVGCAVKGGDIRT